jgi:hypothetical protein
VIGVRDHLELRNPERWNASVEEKLSKLPEILSRARNRRSGQTRETQ